MIDYFLRFFERDRAFLVGVFFNASAAGISVTGGVGILSGIAGGASLDLADLRGLVAFSGFALIGFSFGGIGSLVFLGLAGVSGPHEETAYAQATATRAGMPGSQIIVDPAAMTWAVMQTVTIPANAMLRGKTGNVQKTHRIPITEMRLSKSF